MNNSTMVVTVWYVEHEGKAGVILLNDFALGDFFGGRAGFEAELQRQGFTAARNITTPARSSESDGKRPMPGRRAMDTRKRKTEEAVNEQCI